MHGGDLDVARLRWPNAPEPWIDLSTGINPYAYPIPKINTEAWARLPLQVENNALCEAAALRYGVDDPEMVVVAPGSQSLIQLIPRLFERRTVAIVGPTYSEHALCWRSAGHDVDVVTDIDQSASANVVVVVNPNNPTGRLFSNEHLLALAGALAARKGVLIVDEAFMDFVPGEFSLARTLIDGVVVLRSLGKAFGLAGARLGFGIAKPSLATAINEAVGPWAVSGPALQIGQFALGDTLWIERTKEKLHSDVVRLATLLSDNGFGIVGTTPLFVLTRHKDAQLWRERMGQAGINVRNYAEEPSWIRFGIPGSEQAWARLDNVLRQS